jgi:arylsulfatase A-like enzyme
MLAGLTGVAGPRDTAASSAAAFTDVGPHATAPLFADLERASPGLDYLHRRAVIDGPWKLIVATDDTAHVFDLAQDPGERRDVAPVEAAHLAALSEALHVRDTTTVAARARAQPGTSPMTAERRERLKALGYAQ